MHDLLRDPRVRRLLIANTLGAIGSGITIFAVPWLLVQRPGGNEAYRWATIGTTLALFLVAPAYGAWVDRHSRKTALLASEAWGGLASIALALLGLALGGFSTSHLMGVYFAGMLYYTLHYGAKFALIQQMFARSQFQSLTGLMEIQGQTAMMIAGGLSGLLVERVPLWLILLADGAAFLGAFGLLFTLPYTATHLPAGAPAAGPAASPGPPARSVGGSAWSGVAGGWRWLRDRPRMALFFTSSLLPFVIVMAANYLFPIYVAQTLHAGALTFAGGEITFAAGAVLAGFLLPRLIGAHSAARTVPVTASIFLLGLVAIIVLPFPSAYLFAGALLGFGNAGCRVARSALLLHLVPNEVMGRVGAFFQVLDRILRTGLVFAMGIIDTRGPPAGFVVLAAVGLAALLGILWTRTAAEPAADRAD
ncbi:MAG: MFS transporter [Verrucomicrobia bacterium]|nr:MFS transporter [Verrucomicrobiota bacterium]